MAAAEIPEFYRNFQIPLTIHLFPRMMKVNWNPLKNFPDIVPQPGSPLGVVVKIDAPGKTFPACLTIPGPSLIMDSERKTFDSVRANP